MTFNDVEMLTTEDRTAIVEIIKQIKEEEKRQIEKASGKSSSSPSPPPQMPQKKFSSREVLQQFKPPSVPKR